MAWCRAKQECGPGRSATSGSARPRSQNMNVEQLQCNSSRNFSQEEYRCEVGPDSIDRQIKMDIANNARAATGLPPRNGRARLNIGHASLADRRYSRFLSS